MSLSGFLRTVVDVLNEVGVPYMLTGSLAGAYYAVPRATQDVDLVVDATGPEVDEVVDRLLAHGFYVSREAARQALRTRGQFNAIDTGNGWKADLIIRRDRPFSVVEFERRRPTRLLGMDISLASHEDLIIAKLEWSAAGDSEVQREDVAGLLRAGGASLHRPYIERWVDELGLREEWTRVNARLADDAADAG